MRGSKVKQFRKKGATKAKKDAPLKLDLGCGARKEKGYTGVDAYPFKGVKVNGQQHGDVDVVFDLAHADTGITKECDPVTGEPYRWSEPTMGVRFAKWPWADASVDEIRAAHFVEHLTPAQRCHFFNELYRVMKPESKALIITPYWCSNRAYGDPTHVWPPVSEMTFYYLDKDWRATEAPHTDQQHGGGYNCNFKGITWGYQGHQSLAGRSQEFSMFALQYYKDAAMDLVATIPRSYTAPPAPENGPEEAPTQ